MTVPKVIPGWKAPDAERCQLREYGMFQCVWWAGKDRALCDVHRMLLGEDPARMPAGVPYTPSDRLNTSSGSPFHGA